jgi:hypothetical protein
VKSIFSKDDCAPDAPDINDFCKKTFGKRFDDLVSDAGCQEAPVLKSAYFDSDTTIFLYDGQWYIAKFSCGCYEELFTTTRDEALEKARGWLEKIEES